MELIKKRIMLLFVSGVLSLCLYLTLTVSAVAFEDSITIPAESSQGVVLSLEKGSYSVAYKAGAISLVYPINPNYCWLIGVAIGKEGSGGQDAPDIGTIYFQPRHDVFSQYEAEQLALEAAKGGHLGLQLNFVLDEDSNVRFWISDFDYTDNSGMIKLQIKSLT
jgi:hypothetical protein